MFLLDRALVGGLKFVFGKIAQVAEQEADEEPLLRDRLLEAQMQLEQGAIDDAAYETIEADVLAGLRRIKESRIAAAKAARGNAPDDAPAGERADAANHEGTDGRQTITVEAVELGFEEHPEAGEPEGPARAPGPRRVRAAKPEGSGKRVAAKPKGSGKRAAAKPKGSGKRAAAKPKGSGKRAVAKPGGGGKKSRRG